MSLHIHPIKCSYCNKDFLGYRTNVKFCSDTCRYAWQHQNRSNKAIERRKIYQKKWGQENWQHRRNYMLKYTFGITSEQYNDLLRKQNGNCAICGRHNLEFARKLAIDHDHITSEIRGLLCEVCNRKIIGKHRGIEGVEVFRKAAAYLNSEYTGIIIPPKRKKRRARKSSRKKRSLLQK